MRHWIRIAGCLLLFAASPAWAEWDGERFESLQWREIGPWRGGRSAAVAGIPQDRETFYFGSTGGGVWKTGNGGSSWDNVSDGYFGGSIGAVAVSQWDPNVVYVGTGSACPRSRSRWAWSTASTRARCGCCSSSCRCSCTSRTAGRCC